MATKVFKYALALVVMLSFFGVLGLFGIGVKRVLASFNAESQNAYNSLTSGTLLMSDLIGTNQCLSSPNSVSSITTNSQICSDYPLAQNINSSNDVQINNTGSLLPNSASISTPSSCGVQDFIDSAGNDIALASGTMNYLQPGPTNLGSNSYAVDLNGTNGYGETLSYIASPGPQTFSIAAWFNTTTDGSVIGFTNSQSNTGQSNWDRQLWIDNTGHLVFGLYPNGIYELKSPNTYNNGTWHFVVVTVTDTTVNKATVKMFVDGVHVAGTNKDETLPPPPPGTPPGVNYPAQVYGGWWHLGWSNATQGWPDGPTNPYFTGSLSQIAIFNSVLSGAKITNLYSQTSTTSYDNLIQSYGPYANWTLQDNPISSVYTGTVGATNFSTFFDYSNNPGTNTGTGQGTFSVNSNGPLGGSSTIFNGTSYIKTDSGPPTSFYASPGPQTFSIATWFNTTTDGSIIGFTNSQSNTGQTMWDRQLWIDNTGHLVFGLYPNGIYELKSPNTYNNGTWHFVVITVTPSAPNFGTVLMYVDGNLVAGNINDETYLNGATDPAQVYGGWWHLGWSNAPQGWPDGPTNPYFTGSLSQIAIFNSKLTSADVSTIYGSADLAQYATNVTGAVASSNSYWPLTQIAQSGLPCNYVGLTISDLSDSACVYPVSSSACPNYPVVSGLSVNEPLNINLGKFQFSSFAIGNIPSTMLNLHATVSWQIQSLAGNFTATLIHNSGFVYI